MADRYWRGGTGTWNTTSTTNWSDTSGGAGGFSVPTAVDNVIFDQAATYTVTMTGALTCADITVSAGSVTFATGTTPTLAISGSMSLIGMTWSSTGTITFNASTTGQTILTSATTINAPIIFNGVGGEWTLSDALTTGLTQTITLTTGALSLNNFNITTGIFSSSNTNTRSIAFGSGNIILAHTTAAQTVLNMAIATGFTWTTTTSGGLGTNTGCFEAAMDRTRTFVFGTTGGSITNAPTLYLSSGASIATITTGSYFNELNLGSCSFTIAATSLNVNQLYTASSTCVLTNMTITMRGTGYMQTNNSIGPLIINTSGTVYITPGGTVTCTTCTLTAGTFDLYTNGTLTCSSTCTYSGGSLINIGAINCTTFTVAGANFTLYNGGITPSVSFVITGGTFTYGTGFGTMAAVPTFTHTAGTVNFYQSYSLTTTGTYTFTAGALNLITDITLSTGIFSSSNTNTRSIAFGSTSNAGNIQLTHTTATTVLSMATLTGFTCTGYGGFTVADMANTRTFSVGNTAGGSATNAPSLTFTTGASVATLTTGSWFKDLNFFDTTFTLGTTSLNIAGNLTVGNGLYTTLTITMRGNGYLWNRYNTVTQTIGALTINTTGTINPYPGYTFNCTTLTITAGTLDCTNMSAAITCSSTVTYTAGTLTLDSSTIHCTTFTVNGAAFTFNAGYLTPSVSFVLTSGSFTYGGTANLNDGVLPLFTHTAGTVTLNKSMTIAYSGTAGAGTYTFTAGTLTLAEGSILTCAIFSSSNANTRTINFGTTRYAPSYYNYPVGSNTYPPSYIRLYNQTAASTVLNMAIATGFTWTGSGLFYCEGQNTGTIVFGTTGGSTTNAPNLSISGVSVFTITTGSWFNVFNLINSGYTTPATSVNVVEAFLLWSSGVHTGITIVTKLTTTSIINNGNTFGGLTINVADANMQLAENLLLSGALTLTQGTLNMGTFNVTSASFASAGPFPRSILGTNTTYTISGAGTTAWNFSSTGSVLLNGTTQNLSVANNAAFTFGAAPFTVECWFYQTAFGATNQALISLYKLSTGRAWIFYTTTGGAVAVTTNTGGLSGGTVSLNTWNHVAWVSDGTDFYLYLNGTQVATAAVTPIIASTDPLFIGANNDAASPTWRFSGYITNVRLVKGVAVYTGNFTTPTKPLLPTQSADTNISAITGTQTSLLLSTPSSSFLTDYSNNNFTVTNTGTATANILSPFAVMSPGITFTGFTINMTNVAAKTFAGGGGTYPIINQGGAGALTITGNNTFYNITNTTQPASVTFTAATTTTFKYFSLSGNAGNLVTVGSATTANHTLSMTNGVANTQYMSISRSTATGGAGWIAATSTNGANNAGWVFAAPRFVEMGNISFDTTAGGITFT